MTSNHHALYDLGYKRTTMAATKRSEAAMRSKPHKIGLSSDWSLQLDARQTTRVCNTRSRWPNHLWKEPSKVGQMIGVKS